MLASRFATVLERLAVSTPEISSRMRFPICPSSSISPSTVNSRPRTHFMGCLSKNCWQNSTSLMRFPSNQSGRLSSNGKVVTAFSLFSKLHFLPPFPLGVFLQLLDPAAVPKLADGGCPLLRAAEDEHVA